MDRPSRKTKVVNYSEAKDFDDDEDFACWKVPPSKKARDNMKQEQKKPSSQETNSQSSQSQKSRKPLDGKLYIRDLEAAITLSLLNNTDGKKQPSHTSTGVVKVQLQVDENTDPSTVRLSNCSVNGEIMGLNKITPDNQQPKKAQEQNKGRDEDYKPKLIPESDSDEDYSEEEEFTIKNVSKAKTKDKVTNKTKPTSASKKEKQPSKPVKSKSQAAVRSPTAAKMLPKKASSSSPVVSTSKPSSSVSPAVGKTPKWNPPAELGKSPKSSSLRPAGRSPGQGLRLGLSRLVRVKPLHPSVTSH